MSDLEGSMLSDYLLLQCVNKGGIADIYHARHIPHEAGATSSPREVGVKIFRSSYAQRKAFRDYFMTEAERIGQFDHPNILPFLEYGEGENLLYLVTPFITTGTLDDLLQRVGGHLSATQALPIVQQLCSAIDHAHRHGIVHGNIKPSNVFVAPDGRMLLADFSIARGYDDSQQSLTRVGWGSAEYAAPEQSLGVLRPASDIYSLGVLLFRILTGSPPFVGQTPVEVLLKHVRQAPPSARSVNTHISDAVDAVLMKAMRKRSDERFASIKELADAYAQAVMLSPVASPVARAVVDEPQAAHLPIETLAPHTPVPSFTPSPQTPVPFSVTHPQTPLPHAMKIVPLQEQTQSETPLPHRNSDASFPLHESETLQEIANDVNDKSNSTEMPPASSVDPVEWSPIAEDEQALPGVPMTAGDLLDKPTVVVMESKESDDVKQVTSRAWVSKWLPLIVLVLLIIVLLGAILSAFL